MPAGIVTVASTVSRDSHVVVGGGKCQNWPSRDSEQGNVNKGTIVGAIKCNEIYQYIVL
jgi:hypothetical protein